MSEERCWTVAVEHHVGGRLEKAEALYRAILAADSAHADAMHMLGVLRFQRGDAGEALRWIDSALQIGGLAYRYLAHRGLVLAALGRLEEATLSYRAALDVEPGKADTLINLGGALWTLGRTEEAIIAYRSARESQPDMPETAANLGWALLNTGAFEEAIVLLETALRSHPAHRPLIDHLSVAYNNRAALCLRNGDPATALTILERALELTPELFEAHFNAGKALAQLQRFEEAIPRFEQALARCGDDSQRQTEVQNELGIALYERSRVEEAIRCYRTALRLYPDHPQTCNNLGNALRKIGCLTESILCYRRALQAQPDNAEVWNNLGSVLSAAGDLDGAVETLEKAIQLRPTLSEAHNNLGNVYKDRGEIAIALNCYSQAVVLSPDNQDAHSNRLYTLYFDPDTTPEALYREHRAWSERHAASCYPAHPVPHRRSPANRRLRVGYVAPFFREHCQSLFTVPLLSNHDHERMEVFAYSDVSVPDTLTSRLRGYCDAWRHIAGMSDAAVADMIRKDEIDILVDLSLHMAGNRMLLFARKPAPIQVTWLGYPGTTGLETIDYRLTDPYLDPPTPEVARRYSEETWHLPHTFWCYDPLDISTVPNPLPALHNGYLTFGCLNNFCKINVRTLQLWAEVLCAIPDSRLLLLAPPGCARQWVCDTLNGCGVESKRITFTDRLPRSQYLALYHQIDTGLDTIPYNGHTTTLDSLWMGVPVLTLVGNAPAGRAGWSQLNNVGLQEWAAHSSAEFVQKARKTEENIAALASLRANLRARMERSPLCNGQQFAQEIERAYGEMHGRKMGRK